MSANVSFIYDVQVLAFVVKFICYAYDFEYILAYVGLDQLYNVGYHTRSIIRTSLLLKNDVATSFLVKTNVIACHINWDYICWQ